MRLSLVLLVGESCEYSDSLRNHLGHFPARVEAPRVLESGDYGRLHRGNTSTGIAPHNDVVGKTIQDVYRRWSAVGETRAVYSTANDVAKRCNKALVAIGSAYSTGTYNSLILMC